MKEVQFKKLVETLKQCDLEEGLLRDLLHTLEDLRSHKKYGLVWNKDKVMENVVLECKKKMPILERVKEKRVVDDKNNEHNILIEGDNYHTLQVLHQTHKEKIDVIYIDPPYNTENKDFIYNDKKIDHQDDYRHSKWLSFMEKRLKLAKSLLKETGVIFISIDDNEQANLKLLCDKIFSEENFIASIIWRKKYGGGKGSRFFIDLHEYVLVYAKNITQTDAFSLERTDEQRNIFKEKDKFYKERGCYYIRPLKSGLAYRKNLIYPIKCPDGSEIKTQWICAKSTFEQLKDEERIIFKKLKNGKYNVYKKFYEKDGNGLTLPESIFYDLAYNQNGKEELKDIFNIKEGRDIPFENPKPTKLIKHLLKIVHKNVVVLDFMAGSGTTGHAVLALNKEDGGNRQFILCTNNENNNGNGHGGIAEAVCYPRIKKVMQGYEKNGSDEQVEGLGGGLEYFKTGFVDVNVNALTDRDKLAISKKIGYILGIRHNCFEEKHLNNHYHILENKKESVFIYFEEDLSKFKEFKEHMKEKNGIMYSYAGGAKKRYGIDTKDFRDIRIEKIPEQFVAVYKNCIS